MNTKAMRSAKIAEKRTRPAIYICQRIANKAFVRIESHLKELGYVKEVEWISNEHAQGTSKWVQRAAQRDFRQHKAVRQTKALTDRSMSLCHE
jgi:hypothetical protein